MTWGRVRPRRLGRGLAESVAGWREGNAWWPVNLLYGVLVVIPACSVNLHGQQKREGGRRRNGDVTAVQHAGPRIEGVGGKGHVVAAAAQTQIHAEPSAAPLLLYGKWRGVEGRTRG